MKNNKNSFLQRFELPEDLAKDGYFVEVSNTCAMIDGCKSVAEYSDGIIRLNLGNKTVSVVGNDLVIRCFSCNQVTINGYIRVIEFN